MSSQPRKPTDVDALTPSGAITFEDVVAGMGVEVAGLVERLPDGVDLIERDIAEGSDPDALALLLGSLPDADEVEQLSEALDDPAALNQLLALRDRDFFVTPPDAGRARKGAT